MAGCLTTGRPEVDAVPANAQNVHSYSLQQENTQHLRALTETKGGKRPPFPQHHSHRYTNSHPQGIKKYLRQGRVTLPTAYSLAARKCPFRIAPSLSTRHSLGPFLVPGSPHKSISQVVAGVQLLGPLLL